MGGIPQVYHVIYSGICDGCRTKLLTADSRVTSPEDIFRLLQSGLIIDRLNCSRCSFETPAEFVTVVEITGLSTAVKVDSMPIKEFFKLEPEGLPGNWSRETSD